MHKSLESQEPDGPTMRIGRGEKGAGWAHLGSNQGPLACEASALPLSYAPSSEM